MTSVTTLPQALQANLSNDRSICFISGKNDEVVVTYQELYERAQRLLGIFQSRGLKAGDELIIFLRNNEMFVEVFWAAVLGGIVPVPVAVGISNEHRAKLFRIFNKLEHANLFTDQENLDRLSSYAFEQVMADEFGELKNKTVLLEDVGHAKDPGVLHTASPDDTAFIQFSSGSTSEPKGVVLTHKNLITNMYAIAHGAQYSDQDTSLSWMPLTHDMGLIGFHLNMVLCKMNQCLIPTELFSRRPLLWMQKTSEKKANVLCSPNFGYKHFLKALGDKTLDDVDLSHVRLLYNGAEPISVDLCDEFLQRMSAYGLKEETMFTVYGLAEASLAVAFPEYGKAYQAVGINRHTMRVGQAVNLAARGTDGSISFAIVGPPVKDCLLRITGEDQKVLPDEYIGDIEIAGDNVTQGYYLNDEANAEAITRDGWLKTGDIGFMHQGQLVITGRAKEIIFANGLNYYPHDLESLLHSIDGLELGKVVACGVRQDVSQKEELLVFVLFRAELKDFITIIRQVNKVLNEQFGLEVAHVIPVQRIPKTTSGKVQRRAMAAAYLDGEFDEALSKLARLENAGLDSGPTGSSMEQEIQNIFIKVLEGKPIKVGDNFFELGISSLALAEIHQRIDDQYPGRIDITDLFENQTISEVATFIEANQ